MGHARERFPGRAGGAENGPAPEEGEQERPRHEKGEEEWERAAGARGAVPCRQGPPGGTAVGAHSCGPVPVHAAPALRDGARCPLPWQEGSDGPSSVLLRRTASSPLEGRARWTRADR